MKCDITTDAITPPLAGTPKPPQEMLHAPEKPSQSAVRKLRVQTQPRNATPYFHKGLPHDANGEVDQPAFNLFLEALDDHTPGGFAAIQLGKGRALVNPQGGFAADSETICPWRFRLPPPPKWNSIAAAAEMIELYWMALLREVPFANWATDAGVAAAAVELKDLAYMLDRTNPASTTFRTPKQVFGNGFGPGEVFRGGELSKPAAPERRGPFLSQFLVRDIPFGSLTIPGKQKTVLGGTDYLTDWPSWLEVQRGEDVTPTVPNPDPTPRYIRNMRDLSHYVHVDQLYEAYVNAALLLLESTGNGGFKIMPSKGNPYGKKMDVIGCGIAPDTATSDYPSEIGFGTFGGPHVLSLVTEVATRALKAVWYQKWSAHLRLRPEAYGGLVDRALGGTGAPFNDFPAAVKTLLQNSDAVQRVKAKHGSYLLPMAFPEGSPTHPAYGAGHATVAGACVTVLKAFFHDQCPLPGPVMPAADGLSTPAYTGADAGKLTVGGELDKLAANIAVGRDMGGVHWRTDYSQSVLLGQRVAIDMLYRQRQTYHERCWYFDFTTFGGNQVHIDSKGIAYNGVNLLQGSGSTTAEATKLSKII